MNIKGRNLQIVLFDNEIYDLKDICQQALDSMHSQPVDPRWEETAKELIKIINGERIK